MTALCPHCGQPMLIRLGVKFQPKKAALLDMIQTVTKGRGGVELDTLAWVFYPDAPKKSARDCIKSHICQINDVLCSTDWKIVCEHGLYRLVERSEVK